MNKTLAALIVVIGLFGTVAIYLVTKKDSGGKHGFIVNQTVFDKYTGKLLLERDIKTMNEKHKRSLDSLISISNDASSYERLAQQYSIEERNLSDKYTEDIWKEINVAVQNYGKEKGYDFIYGAVGNGSLMYGDSENDISNDVIIYINDKYEGNN